MLTWLEFFIIATILLVMIVLMLSAGYVGYRIGSTKQTTTPTPIFEAVRNRVVGRSMDPLYPSWKDETDTDEEEQGRRNIRDG